MQVSQNEFYIRKQQRKFIQIRAPNDIHCFGGAQSLVFCVVFNRPRFIIHFVLYLLVIV
jgi:hypothetical protein